MKNRDIQQSCCGLHTGEALAQHPPNWRISLLAWAVLLCGLLVSFSARNYCQSNPPAKRVEAELITVRRDGFEPKEITRPAGQFLLAIDNRSGLEVVTVRLDRQAGARLRDIPVNWKERDWRDLLDLTPGRYVLTEATHPGWVCNITITAH